MVNETKTKRVEARFAPTELAMLQALSEADGISLGDVMRMLVRRAYADRFGEKPPKSKKK